MAKVKKRFFDSNEEKETIRINKFLSDAGICSRREADSHIKAGEVHIDGEIAKIGSVVLPGQIVTFRGKPIKKEEKLVLLAFHKPLGIVCTTDRKEPNNIIDFINYGSRIYPVGRLDKDSEGLILLTNDGNIVNKILRAGNNHEKEYIVTVNKTITAEFLKSMSSGVPILGTVTKPCVAEAIDKKTFRILLTQGLNRQIRRMCEQLGYNVTKLQRIRIMNINLGRLKEGGYRNLTDWELKDLNLLIQDSSNAPVIDAGGDKKTKAIKYNNAKNMKVLHDKKLISGKQHHKNSNMMDKLATPLEKKKYSKSGTGNKDNDRRTISMEKKTENGNKKNSNLAGKTSQSNFFKGNSSKGGNKSLKEQGYGRNAATFKRAGRNAK